MEKEICHFPYNQLGLHNLLIKTDIEIESRDDEDKKSIIKSNLSYSSNFAFFVKRFEM